MTPSKYCLLLFLLPALVSEQATAEGSKRVLLVHSYGRDYAPFSDPVSRFRVELASRYDHPISFFEVSVEGTKYDHQNRNNTLFNYLTAIYHDTPPDLIVPIGAQAAMFCELHRKTLFPDAPALLFSVEDRRLREVWKETGMTSVGLELDSSAWIKNIISLRPETRYIYVVTGSSGMERFWEEQYRKEWVKFEERVTFRWLNDQPLKEMEKTVASLPPDSAILFTFLNCDAAGISYEAGEALRPLVKVANAPVFGTLHQQIGQGIVGGALYPARRIADRAAIYGSRILGGTSANRLAPLQIPFTHPVFDWSQLERWNIPESLLPEGSMVMGRPPSLWRAHPKAVSMALLLIGLQAATIALFFKARQRARDTADRLSLAADSAKIGLWEQSPDSDKLNVSSRWREIFGVGQDDPVHVDDILSRVHPDDRTHLLKTIEVASENGSAFTAEHRITLPDGTIRWISTHGRISAKENGQTDGNLLQFLSRGASIDITKRHEAETTTEIQRQELAHLSRVSSLGVLSGALVHEMNQPLGIILSNAQAAEKILEGETPDLVELREIVSDIVSEDKRAGSVIHRLRALLSRGETNLALLDVNENIRQALRLTRSNLLVTQVRVDLHLSETLPPVKADRIQLQQTVLNLVVNACDAMANRPVEERVLTIESSLDDNEILIAVRDRGVGLPEDTEQLFEPFHTTKETGLGMGLAICRTLVISHSGRLWAESEPDGGAIFFLSLPTQTETP